MDVLYNESWIEHWIVDFYGSVSAPLFKWQCILQNGNSFFNFVMQFENAFGNSQFNMQSDNAIFNTVLIISMKIRNLNEMM